MGVVAVATPGALNQAGGRFGRPDCCPASAHEALSDFQAERTLSTPSEGPLGT